MAKFNTKSSDKPALVGFTNLTRTVTNAAGKAFSYKVGTIYWEEDNQYTSDLTDLMANKPEVADEMLKSILTMDYRANVQAKVVLTDDLSKWA
jgi:hypothetical protein